VVPGLRAGELCPGVVEVARPSRRVREVTPQHLDQLRMQAGQRGDAAQLCPTGRDLAAAHEHLGPRRAELWQVVVVAEFDGQRDRLVEGADRSVELAGDALQAAER